MKHSLASGFVLAAGAAQAGGTFDSTGTITGQSTAKIYPVAEGQMVMELTNTHDTFEMAAERHPFSGLSADPSFSPLAIGDSYVCSRYSLQNKA